MVRSYSLLDLKTVAFPGHTKLVEKAYCTFDKISVHQLPFSVPLNRCFRKTLSMALDPGFCSLSYPFDVYLVKFYQFLCGFLNVFHTSIF